MRRGDIYYVSNHNTTGAEIAKSRPAVIVSDNTLNATSEAVEVVFLTSQPKREMHTHAIIHATGRESVALCEQVNTVARSRLGDYFGHCNEDEMARIDHALLASLGLTAPEPEQADPPPLRGPGRRRGGPHPAGGRAGRLQGAVRENPRQGGER